MSDDDESELATGQLVRLDAQGLWLTYYHGDHGEHGPETQRIRLDDYQGGGGLHATETQDPGSVTSEAMELYRTLSLEPLDPSHVYEDSDATVLRSALPAVVVEDIRRRRELDEIEASQDLEEIRRERLLVELEAFDEDFS